MLGGLTGSAAAGALPGTTSHDEGSRIGGVGDDKAWEQRSWTDFTARP